MSFTGRETVMEAKAWLKTCEKIFRGLELEDHRKRSWLLKDEAQNWWETVIIGNNEADMSWANFKELFNEKLFLRKK